MCVLILAFRQGKSSIMDKLDIPYSKAAQILQADLPLVANPFVVIAEECGLSGDSLLGWVRELLQKGDIRKFGAILRHQKAGYRKNALVLWVCPANAIEKVGNAFAALSSVSHCYERKPAFQNKYNLFTMLHSREDSLKSLLTDMSRLSAISDYLVLESLQEYKKTSPEYFYVS